MSISTAVLAAAIAFSGPAAATIGVVITRPHGTALARNELVRGNTYYASSVALCRTLTVPPRVKFNGVDIGTTGCKSVGHATFNIRSDAPIARGTLIVVTGSLELQAGTFDVVAPPPPPAPAQLSVSPAQLSFTANPYAGNEPPHRQTFEIRNTGGGTLSWTVSENLRPLMIVVNETCAVPPTCPGCGIQCSGGNRGTMSSGSATITGSGNAIVAVRAPGWTLSSGITTTGTITIATNAGNATVTVTITTPANLEFDCSNGRDDDGDGAVDSIDSDCAPNPFAGF
jgi:hypothetical protein